MTPPDIRAAFAADGVRIAYQIFGTGGVDLVVVPGWISHLRLNWAEPSVAAFLQRLAGFARVVIIDKRGTGCSERVGSVPDLETRMDDLRAVLDAEGLGRVVLFGESSGAAIATLFAATYPQRTRAVVLSNARARAQWDPDYLWGSSPEAFAEELKLIRDGWDSGDYVRSFVAPLVAPSQADDEEFLQRFTSYHQQASSREDALALSEMWWEIDYRTVLPSVGVPTLLLAHERNRDEVGYLTQRIPGARLVLLDAPDSGMWSPAGHAVTDAIHEFLGTVIDEEADFDRVLATVLFTDIVNSTEHSAAIGDRRWDRIRRQHDEMTNGHVVRYRGRALKSTGDGYLATFDGPARAVRCSLALTGAVTRLGIEIRAGLHTGEVEFDVDDVHGLTVVIAARVAAKAGPTEVLVSRTVRDLVAGSGLRFSDAGTHLLKGVPGRWNLFRACPTAVDGPAPAIPSRT